MSKIKITLCVPIFANLHLLKRSIESYTWQDFPHDAYEIIFFDDNSPDNPESFVREFMDKQDVAYTYIKCVHNFGWRGCTIAFNTMFQMARGEILCETTAETVLQPNVISELYKPHIDNKRCFVALRTYNLTKETQSIIDTVDWRSDLYNIKNLKGFDDPWTQGNVKTTNFVTHQTCSIHRDVFREVMPQGKFPLANDYGFEDPYYSGMRDNAGVQGITLLEPMPIHQWHPSLYWHFAHDLHAPHLNKHMHTTSNVMQDTSGAIPEGGTCEIWDGGSHDKMNEEEKKWWRDDLDEWVKKTGGYFYKD